MMKINIINFKLILLKLLILFGINDIIMLVKDRNIKMEEHIMDFNAIVTVVLEFVNKLLSFLGEGEAASIVDIVKGFLGNLDIAAILDGLKGIIG